MTVPQEVDDLERLISSLQQELTKKKSSLKPLQIKIEAAKLHLERCKQLRETSRKNLEKVRKEDVVSLSDFKRWLNLFEDNSDLVIRYQIELSNRTIDRLNIEKEIPLIEEALNEAKKSLAEWGVVIQMRAQ